LLDVKNALAKSIVFVLMHLIVVIIILTAYILLAMELVFLHVPSVASVYQLIWSKKSIVNYSHEQLKSGKLYEVLHWSLIKKISFLAIPTGVSIITGLLPLAFIFYILFFDYSWSYFNNSFFLQNLAGVFLIIGGRIITLYATFKIRTDNQQKEDSFQLKTNGVFSLSRNPLLVGMYVMYAGMFVIFPVILFGIGLLVYFFNMHFRILLEEDFLEFQFGAPFKKYKQTVKRYL
jgi:protein-S-isoprenylcysteine O-methyltransferase Ste14